MEVISLSQMVVQELMVGQPRRTRQLVDLVDPEEPDLTAATAASTDTNRMKVLAAQALLALQQQLQLDHLSITAVAVAVAAAGTLKLPELLLVQLEVLVVADQVRDIHKMLVHLPVLPEQQTQAVVEVVALPVMVEQPTR
jgi:hypothetical protein